MPTASPKAWKKFDYTALDASTSQFVQQQTGEIRGLMKRTANDIVEIGQKLVNVKEKLGHGRFGSWLEAEFDWSIQTAKRFMNVAAVFQNQQIADFEFIAPSALYELAAPSIPDAVRKEAFARAKAGEPITYKAAKDIKQKYALSNTKSESTQEVRLVPQLSSITHTPLPRIKQEIVAIRNTAPVEVSRQDIAPALERTVVLQPSTSAPIDDEHGVWWQLGTKHLLYSGDPNSLQFLERISNNLGLLLAFPSDFTWQPPMQAKTRIVTNDYLPQNKDVRLFEDMIETSIILYSNVRDVVVSCFIPSIEILSIINRQDRRALIAEPDSRRVNAIISDWKQAGLKAERLT